MADRIIPIKCPACGSISTGGIQSQTFGGEFKCSHCGTTSALIVDQEPPANTPTPYVEPDHSNPATQVALAADIRQIIETGRWSDLSVYLVNLQTNLEEAPCMTAETEAVLRALILRCSLENKDKEYDFATYGELDAYLFFVSLSSIDRAGGGEYLPSKRQLTFRRNTQVINKFWLEKEAAREAAREALRSNVKPPDANTQINIADAVFAGVVLILLIVAPISGILALFLPDFRAKLGEYCFGSVLILIVLIKVKAG